MSDAWKAVKIGELEHVVTGPSVSLLRISAKAPRRGSLEPRPTLLIDDGLQTHRFEPIKAPPEPRRLLRAAYAVPSALIGPDGEFWLEHKGGARTTLPKPKKSVARVIRREHGHDEPPADPGVPQPAADSELARARERITTLERQLRNMTFERDDLSRQAVAIDDVAVKARERATQGEAACEKASATLSELEIWRGELERRLAETTSQLGVAKAAREADQRELVRLRSALAESEMRSAG